MKSTSARGYGYKHRQLRAELLPFAIGRPYNRCGQPMNPGQPLDLDHNDNRDGYRGFAHAKCNRRAGANKVNGMANQEAHDPKPRGITRW